MKKSLPSRLNIFIDETGEFGFNKRSAKFYGVSLVFHEQKNDISKEIKILEDKFSQLGFQGTVHMGDLIMGHRDFAGMNIAERRKIYTTLYKFSRQINATYHTIIIEKKNIKDNRHLSRVLCKELQAIIEDRLIYFQKYENIRIYYDKGQKSLNKIINKAFGVFEGYEQISDFDHQEKKLFQVADMLTYVDKIIYKYKHGIKLTKTETAFFDIRHIKMIKSELMKHRLNSK